MRQLTPLVAAVALLIASPVLAQSQSGSGTSQSTQNAPSASTSAPSDAMTVTAYYKQNVYDQNNNKIGQIVDLLMTKDGKIDKVVVGAGGFLGMGKHDVMLPFSSVKMQKEADRTAASADRNTNGRQSDRNRDRNANASNSYRLTMDTSKDALKNQPGVKYDRTAMTWVPDNSSSSSNQSTTGRKSNR
jgi:sporulation protein YlmC with PRC-barrel domain